MYPYSAMPGLEISYANLFFRLVGDGVTNGVYGIHARKKKLLFCTTLIVSTVQIQHARNEGVRGGHDVAWDKNPNVNC